MRTNTQKKQVRVTRIIIVNYYYCYYYYYYILNVVRSVFFSQDVTWKRVRVPVIFTSVNRAKNCKKKLSINICSEEYFIFDNFIITFIIIIIINIVIADITSD